MFWKRQLWETFYAAHTIGTSKWVHIFSSSYQGNFRAMCGVAICGVTTWVRTTQWTLARVASRVRPGFLCSVLVTCETWKLFHVNCALCCRMTHRMLGVVLCLKPTVSGGFSQSVLTAGMGRKPVPVPKRRRPVKQTARGYRSEMWRHHPP